MSMVAIQRLNGAYERVGEDETAFGGSRAATWVFNMVASHQPRRC